jgi:hypothetical protein
MLKAASMQLALLVATFWLSNCVNPQMAIAAKIDCRQADAELRHSERIPPLPIPTTGNYDADFNARQMQLAQHELIAAHFEISCGTNPKAIQAAKDLEQQANDRLKLYGNLPRS